MIKSNLSALSLAVSLGCISLGASAHLSTPKADVNSKDGDRVVVTVSFPAPVKGDLYLAVDVGGGTYLFFTAQGGISPSPVSFSANGDFSQDIKAIDLPTTGIPAGKYAVYQVVANSGSNVYDPNNWIGGFGGLSQLALSINLNNTASTFDGKASYKSLTCSSSSCHSIDPAANKNNVLRGTNLAAIRFSINTKNSGDMGFLSSTSDAELQAVADYLKTF